MADVKISGLPASTVPLAGTEVLPIVQGGATKQVSIANVTAGRVIAASGVTTDTYKAASSAGGTLQANNATACLQWGAGGGSGLIFDGGISSTAANAALVFSPTGTGTVAISPTGALTINPTAVSTINNVSIGVTTPLAGKFTTLESSGDTILGTNAAKVFASGGVSIGNTTDPGATNLSVTGNLFVNTTSNFSTPARQFTKFDEQAEVGLTLQSTNATTGGAYIYFVNSAGALAGNINHTTSTTVAYLSVSDQRLKENIVDSPDVLTLLNNVKVRSYDWIEDKTHVNYGFIAQELYLLVPEVIGKGDDAKTISDHKGTWQIDYARLTPLLVKAIQELNNKFDAYVASHP